LAIKKDDLVINKPMNNEKKGYIYQTQTADGVDQLLAFQSERDEECGSGYRRNCGNTRTR